MIHLSYEEIPYVSGTYSFTHPRWTGTLARTLGVQSANPAVSRILEIGCGDGSNILPIAGDYPLAHLEGFDLSESAIEKGLDLINKCNLSNIKLFKGDINEESVVTGKFDYIIAHGVLSWISDSTRAKLFKLISDHLSPAGIAFISFNSFPGWHIRLILREAILLRINPSLKPHELIAVARTTLQEIVQLKPKFMDIGGDFLEQEVKKMLEMPDWFLFHDLLEQYNQPFYLKEVLEFAQESNLKFVCDTDLVRSSLSLQNPHISRVEQEQSFDIIGKRCFRSILLCKSDIPVKEHPDFSVLGASNIIGDLKPEFELLDHRAPVTEKFSHKQINLTISVKDPKIRLSLRELSKLAPQAVAFETFLSTLGTKYGCTSDDIQNIAKNLFNLMCTGVISFSAFPFPEIPSALPDKPKVSPLAREQSTSILVVPNAFHQSVPITLDSVPLIKLLDGTRSIDQIVKELKVDAPIVFQKIQELWVQGLLEL